MKTIFGDPNTFYILKKLTHFTQGQITLTEVYDSDDNFIEIVLIKLKKEYTTIEYWLV